jgi:hypothetical protein
LELEFAFLANAVEGASNGLFNALGAGWDVGTRPQFPAPFGGVLAAKVKMNRQEFSHPHTFELDIVDQDGHSIVPRVRIPFQVPANAPEIPSGHRANANLVFNLHNVLVPHAGSYSLEFLADGMSLKSLPIAFNLGQPQ